MSSPNSESETQTTTGRLMAAGQTEVQSAYGFRKYVQGSKFQPRKVVPVNPNTPLGLASFSSKRNAWLEPNIPGILYNVVFGIGAIFLVGGILSWLPQ